MVNDTVFIILWSFIITDKSISLTMRCLKTLIVFFGIYLSLMIELSFCLHLSGTWHTSNFYKFLVKFGFQKTDPGLLDDTQGFVYGNITSSSKHKSYFTLVLVDSEYFVEFYGNQTILNSRSCSKMFHKIDHIAYDNPCNGHGTEDFLRKVPCRDNQLCIDEDNPANVLSGYQFTYRIQNSARPRFWYLSLVACRRNKCQWISDRSTDFDVKYDIWLVNGDPAAKHLNPFEHQFSFEMHDVFEIYAIFLFLYIPTTVVWIYAYKQQVHLLTMMLTACISTEFAGVVFNFLHVLIFSLNGVGAVWLKFIGNFLGIFSECLFMLVLLVIVKGWTITSLKLQSKRPVFCFWGIYTALNAIFFIVSLTKLDQITNIDEWNSWPGYLIVGFRIVIMVWFFLELRSTLLKSKHQGRLDFLQQFAAFYLVWFCYLPILVIIADQISFLWRYKTILSITYAADWLSYVVLIHLLWPSRSVLYLIKADTPLSQYELEATGLVDPDDEGEVLEFSADLTRNNREPYRLIKQETRLPTIQEMSPARKENGRKKAKGTGKSGCNGTTKHSHGGKMKVKGKFSGSKTRLLDDEELNCFPIENREERATVENVYMNINLNDSDDEDIKQMDFEIL